MHPKVRDLYKRIVFVGREYPLGVEWVRLKAKPWIRQNKDIKDEVEILKQVKIGRYWVKEMEGVIQLKKLRTMKRNYGENVNNQLIGFESRVNLAKDK